MRRSTVRKSSLITETPLQSLKLPKLSNRYTSQEQSHKCRQITSKKDNFYTKPQLKKILYPPFNFQNQKEQSIKQKKLLMESCVLNKKYDEVSETAMENRLRSYLSNSTLEVPFERQSGLQKNKPLIGRDAPLNYYKQYKKLSKYLNESNQNDKENRSVSPYFPMLAKTSKLQILPLCMGIVKYNGDQSILNLNNYKLGDKYIEAMSAGLKEAKLIERCYFSHNRISDKGMQELAKNLNLEIIVLDLSYNYLSAIPNKLLQLIIGPQARLEQLNLQHNKIKAPQVINTLFQNVMLSKHLKVLNLRANGLNLQTCDAICDLLQIEHGTLEQLYLGTNYLTAKAGERIFNQLQNNKNIKVLDYSLNNLGQDENYACTKAIANCLLKNKTLQHLDLSSNNFDEISSKMIAQGLQPNRKLYGFHFTGNYGYVDARGFLIMEETQSTSLHTLVQSKINSYEIVYNRKNISTGPKLFKNVCWICEGWYEQQFRFVIPESFQEEKKLVYIHFDFELFAPRLINLTDRNVKYTTMVPPKRYQYFFTFNGKQFIDQNGKIVKLDFPEKFTYEMYHQMITFKVQQVSQKKGKQKKIANDWHQIIIKTLPRNTGLVSKKEKEPWTFGKSVWAKEWKLDNQDILRKCFERDWKCSKLMNLVKNQADQDKLKNILFKNYKAIKLVYRYFSSWSPFGDIWAVSNNSWTQFCQQAKIINKETPLKITDLTFITTNSMSGADWKGNQLVPERGLIRFQFMEALVRLSEQKFKKNGLTQNFSDSINMLLEEHVLPLSRTLNHETWRTQQFFVQQNDILLKKYRPIFTYVYKKNSKLKVKPGQKPFMCLNEFRAVMEKANLAGSYVLQRDIFISYNFGMMTQVDQIQNERFMKMTEIQFIEALARCSTLLPANCSISNQKNNRMCYKFEWLIAELKKTQCNEDIKNQFPEVTSIFDEIEEE